jgi:hypothetical protein
MKKNTIKAQRRRDVINAWTRRSALIFLKFAGLLLYQMSHPALAGDFRAERWWLQTGGLTHHIDSQSNRNGENYGLGVEYKFSQTQSIRTGIFKNSYDRDAAYFSYVWLPWKLRSARVGANFAAAGAYANRTGALIAVIPWAELTWNNIGIELGVVPVRNGIVTLQFKFRIE